MERRIADQETDPRPAATPFRRAPFRYWTLPALLLVVPPASPGAQPPYSKAGLQWPAVMIETGATPDSVWRLQVDPHGNSIQVASVPFPQLSFTIDADGPEDDGHYEGISFRIGTRRREGRFHGSMVSFLSPDHDAGRVRRVLVQALQTRLRIRFEGGSYRNLSDAGTDEAVWFEAVFQVNEQRRLAAVLNGLYYLFPSTAGTRVTLRGQWGETSRTVDSQTAAGYQYFEDVLRMDFDDPQFGRFWLEGLIRRVQLHHHGADGGDLFEVDLDHSYKDRGQKEVLLRFLLDEPLAAAGDSRSPSP